MFKLSDLDFIKLPDEYNEYELNFEDPDFFWISEFYYTNSVIDYLRATKKIIEKSTLKLSDLNDTNLKRKIVADECIRLINLNNDLSKAKDKDLNNHGVLKYTNDLLFALITQVMRADHINIRVLIEEELSVDEKNKSLTIKINSDPSKHFYSETKSYFYIILNIFYHCKWFKPSLQDVKMRQLPTELERVINEISPNALKAFLQNKYPRTDNAEILRYRKIKNLLESNLNHQNIRIDPLIEKKGVQLTYESYSLLKEILLKPLRIYTSSWDMSEILDVIPSGQDMSIVFRFLIQKINSLIGEPNPPIR